MEPQDSIPVRPAPSHTGEATESRDEYGIENVGGATEVRDNTKLQKLSYGTGHFYNDLCASMWFSYFMIFLEKVLKMRPPMAGFLMLVGQVTDALCTPLIGLASDAELLPTLLLKMGRRISWHVIGTICVTVSFPFIFNKCLLCSDSTADIWREIWYIPHIMLFQFGWAAVQISHLALIPDLSHLNSGRATMNSIRYGFTVLANLTVFGLLAVLLGRCSMPKSIIDFHDLKHFRMAGFSVVGLGLFSCVAFYAITREPASRRTVSRRTSDVSQESTLSRMHWTTWFGNLQFYKIALLYMLARLYMNISQVYMPFYLTMTQNMEKKMVAVVPMTSFLSSFFVSLLFSLSYINERTNKKMLYVLGLMVGGVNCGCMLYDLHGWRIYGVAIGLGVAQSILLLTSLDITADLINKNTESGAFVYGAMSLTDKFANGVAYQIIEILNPACGSAESHEACSNFYRVLMVYVTGGCLLFSFLVLLALLPDKIGERFRSRAEDLVTILDNEEEVHVAEPSQETHHGNIEFPSEM